MAAADLLAPDQRSRLAAPAGGPARRHCHRLDLLGMVPVFRNRAVYPAYANSAHHVMTVLDDQQLSGAVLWMGMLPAAVTVGVALLKQWLDNEESADVSAGLDRLLAPRRGGWPSRPVIR